jgi:hypothetical protein
MASHQNKNKISHKKCFGWARLRAFQGFVRQMAAPMRDSRRAPGLFSGVFLQRDLLRAQLAGGVWVRGLAEEAGSGAMALVTAVTRTNTASSLKDCAPDGQYARSTSDRPWVWRHRLRERTTV